MASLDHTQVMLSEAGNWVDSSCPSARNIAPCTISSQVIGNLKSVLSVVTARSSPGFRQMFLKLPGMSEIGSAKDVFGEAENPGKPSMESSPCLSTSIREMQASNQVY